MIICSEVIVKITAGELKRADVLYPHREVIKETELYGSDNLRITTITVGHKLNDFLMKPSETVYKYTLLCKEE